MLSYLEDSIEAQPPRPNHNKNEFNTKNPFYKEIHTEIGTAEFRSSNASSNPVDSLESVRIATRETSEIPLQEMLGNVIMQDNYFGTDLTSCKGTFSSNNCGPASSRETLSVC